MDTRTSEQRTMIMRTVRQKDTGPEMKVRSLLHSLGYRYRLHSDKLPGKPDICFASRRKVIFVHGCFWHSHECPKGRPPKSRGFYWRAKLDANRARDKRVVRDLEAMGWQSLIVWQCELSNGNALASRLTKFLNDAGLDD